jgi:sugar lactone lactonase YvrE
MSNTIASSARIASAFLLLSGGAIAVAQQYTVTTFAGGSPPTTPAPAVSTSIGMPRRITVDAAGNLYFSASNSVFKMDAHGVLTLVAGNSRSGYSGDGGPASAAQLSGPQGVAVDNAGNVYIADTLNNVVRIVTPDGLINTFAGNGTQGYSGDTSPAAGAQLYAPTGLAVDSAGNLYIVDTENNAIREVTTDGNINTIVGNGYMGYGGDGAAAAAAQVSLPQDIFIDKSGNIFIADSGNTVIREITASTGNISTVAGGSNDTLGTNSPGDGGTAITALLTTAVGVAVDSSGNIYISENYPGIIRQVDTKGIITTIAGTTEGFSGDGSAASKAQLLNPLGLTVDSSGNLYVADSVNLRIRKIASGNISTVAGNGVVAFSGDGGPAPASTMHAPAGAALDAAGNVYVSDSLNSRLRKVGTDGTIATFAGTGANGSSGDGAQAAAAQIGIPWGVATDAQGNVYVADSFNNRVRKIGPDGTIGTLAGNGTAGYGGDGGPASNAELYTPLGLATDAAGNVYIADFTNSRVRVVNPGGIITTLAGTGASGYSGDGGPASQAQLSSPEGVAVDSAGNVYIADTANNVIRRIGTNGNIATIAGTGLPGHDGDGGPAVQALLAAPEAVAIDAAGNLYIADSGARVRVVTTDGNINTIAGMGAGGYAGDGGPALNALFNRPTGLALDKSGDIYVADYNNNAVRLLQLQGSSSEKKGAQPGATTPGRSWR